MANLSLRDDTPSADMVVDPVTKWVVGLFFVALFIPGSFYIGVRMTPFRFLLIVMAIPMILRFRMDPTMRVTPLDVLMFLATFWRALSILLHHGTSEIANAASGFMELFFGYLLGRVYLRSAADYRYFCRCFLITLVAFLPFALVELVMRRELLRQVFGLVLEQTPIDMRSQNFRMGMMRVQLSFDHAILYGTFCVICFSNAYYVFRDRAPLNLVYAAFVAFMTLLALSSSSILALGLQAGLIAYAAVFRLLPYKWLMLFGATLFVWFGFSFLFGKTVIEWIVQDLVFNTIGAETRLDQMAFGLREVARNPIFGVGLNDIALPFWRGNVIDNFWLFTAIRYGIPGVFFIAAAFLVNFFSIAAVRELDETESKYRLGYMIAFATNALVISTLTIWGIGLVFVMVYIGAGAWFYDRPRKWANTRLKDRPRNRSGVVAGGAGPAGRFREASSRMRATPSVPQSRR